MDHKTVEENTEYLREHLPEEQLTALKAAVKEIDPDKCYVNDGVARLPRPFVGTRRFSLRSLLYFAMAGEFRYTMPLPTCECGCYNPHHAMFNGPGDKAPRKPALGSQRNPFSILNLRDTVRKANSIAAE